jgi:hypothetical protein
MNSLSAGSDAVPNMVSIIARENSPASQRTNEAKSPKTTPTMSHRALFAALCPLDELFIA